MRLELRSDLGEGTGPRMTTVVQGDGEVDFAAGRARVAFTLPFGRPEATTETIVDGSTVCARLGADLPLEELDRFRRDELTVQELLEPLEADEG